MFKQWWVTAGLLIVIAIVGVKIVQLSVVRQAPPPPVISFTCAVAVDHQVGELCVDGLPGASVSIEVWYCDGSRISSPLLRSQTAGEYRWIWHVQTACRGQARATATATWPDNRRSEALATFEVV